MRSKGIQDLARLKGAAGCVLDTYLHQDALLQDTTASGSWKRHGHSLVESSSGVPPVQVWPKGFAAMLAVAIV